MIEREKIAHDLALIWVEKVLDGKLTPVVEKKSIVEEYFAAYQNALEKMDALESEGTTSAT